MEDCKEENLNRYQVGIDLGKDEGNVEYVISAEDFLKYIESQTKGNSHQLLTEK